MELEEKVGVKAQSPVCASQHVGGTPRGREASRSSESGGGVRQWSGGNRNLLASRAIGGNSRLYNGKSVQCFRQRRDGIPFDRLILVSVLNDGG